MAKRSVTSFYKPIFRVLKEMGGIAKRAEIIRRVVTICGCTEAELAEIAANGAGVIDKRISWARQHLILAGYLESAGRGIWRLTARGTKINEEDLDVHAIRRMASQMWSAPKKSTAGKERAESGPPPGENETEGSPEIVRDHLRMRLNELEGRAFERLCETLLVAIGFESVKLTPKARDGGYDARGLLPLAGNPFVVTSFVFECKRYTDSPVGDSVVRGLRGAMAGGRGAAEKGAIITTSRFSRAAIEEAGHGSSRIELVDGEKLLDLLEEYLVGVKIVKTKNYRGEEEVREIDEDFFQFIKRQK